MAKFKKGQSGNPNGRPKVPEHIRKLKELTTEEVKQMGDAIVLGTRQDLTNIIADRSASPLSCWIAAVVLRGIQRGDVQSLNVLLDRLVGKVTDKVQHMDPMLTIIEKINGSETHLGAKLVEKK